MLASPSTDWPKFTRFRGDTKGLRFTLSDDQGNVVHPDDCSMWLSVQDAAGTPLFEKSSLIGSFTTIDNTAGIVEVEIVPDDDADLQNDVYYDIALVAQNVATGAISRTRGIYILVGGILSSPAITLPVFTSNPPVIGSWSAILNKPASLAAIAALTPAANKLAYFTGATTAALTDFTAAARALLDDADFAAMRTTLGLGAVENTALSTWAGTAGLTTLGAITSGTWNATTIAILHGGTGATTAAGARSALGVAIGTDVQAYSANLVTFAGIAPSANIQTFLGSANYAAMRTQLSLGTAALLDAGSASGVATLDSGGKIPLSQIPDSVLGQVEYKGTWNATTNSPALSATPGAASLGFYYVVSTAGTQFGITFDVGDWIISNGTTWDKVDNTDAVMMVAGRTGAITLVQADITGLTTASSPTFAAVTAATFTGALAGNADTANSLTTRKTIVYEGDSRTDAATSSWASKVSTAFAQIGVVAPVNQALSGDTAQAMVGEYTSQVHPYRPLISGDTALFYLFAGTNDLRAGRTAAQVEGDLKTIWAAARADGFIVVAFTDSGSTALSGAQEAERQTLNTAIRGDIAYFDFLVDVDRMFPDTGDSAIYSDGTHFTPLGNRLIARAALDYVGSDYAAFPNAIKASGPLTLTTAGAQIVLRDSLSDATAKEMDIVGTPYTTSHSAFTLVHGFGGSSDNYAALGGGSPSFLAATHTQLYAAANNNTATGTLILDATIDGVAITGNALVSNTLTTTALKGVIVELRDSVTNATAKAADLVGLHYTSAQKYQIAHGFSAASDTYATLGGGSSSYYAATHTQLYAAANNTTTAGTLILDATIAGVAIVGALSTTTAFTTGAPTGGTAGAVKFGIKATGLTLVLGTNALQFEDSAGGSWYIPLIAR